VPTTPVPILIIQGSADTKGAVTATSIAVLLRARRAAVTGTYALTLIENVCTLAYPALTGRAVDDLVERKFHGLVMLVGVWLLHLAIAFVRQRLDTRVFMGLYAQIASHIVGVQQEQGHGTSKVSARVEMVRDIVGFFEKEVPAMFHNVVAVVGSLVMLFIYDVDAGFIAMAVLLPMGLINAWYWRRAVRLNRGINNQIEREVDDIAGRAPRPAPFLAAAALARQAVRHRIMDVGGASRDDRRADLHPDRFHAVAELHGGAIYGARLFMTTSKGGSSPDHRQQSRAAAGRTRATGGNGSLKGPEDRVHLLPG
jgi:hypothetical protein